MNEILPLPEDDDPGSWIGWTSRQQAIASDPARSAWVSANAGSGKTHVLTQRVIRLLLNGARPSSILCLTYTKAAASEMSNRVFQRLAAWAVLEDDALKAKIAEIEGSEPSLLKIAEARRLFAKALETPGGLKIQTIHAFCEALLHQFPLEANVAGHFSVLDDRAAVALLADARRSLLAATALEDDIGLADAFAAVLTLADETGLETLLADVVANRLALKRFLDRAAAEGGALPALRRRLGLGPGEDEASIAADYWPLPGFGYGDIEAYIALASEKGKAKAMETASAFMAARAETDPVERAKLLEALFLKKNGEPRADAQFFVKAMLADQPDLAERVALARAHVASCRDRLRIMRMFEATRAALTLAARLNDDYEALKKQRSQLDFDDLITRTADLLTKSDVGPWVHYKLDQGIDHILVDEAQDTSPVQWSVIQSLAEDFFSGESARAGRRTLFAVGDEKQSIYSFQGARPERFSEESRRTQQRVGGSGQLFSSVRLPLSFRSTADVLSVVDHVFATPANARGLSAEGEPVVHRSSRIGHPGAVDLWDTIAPEESPKDEDWTAPFDATPESAPPAVLARRIAHAIGQMVGRETIVEGGRERPIRAGDILVLVRKRDSFVNALTRALKRRGDIPVAGADRLRLTSHIAVQDLVALGRFLLLPRDDLSLAALLKSPLFDLDEEALFRLAAYREDGESLWDRLKTQAEDEAGIPAVRGIVATLSLWAEQSRCLPVHDFYARVLGVHGGRQKFLARLGTEVSDILDEFLVFALEHERTAMPGLQAFVSTLELEAPEVKREQDKGRNEVRIMTVHASKGLEAPIVFLVDGGSKAFNHTHMPKLRLIDIAGEEVPVWIPISDLGNSLTQADSARVQALAEEEYRRLLYVGMTRAADRLIVCGYRGIRAVSATWHSMISEAMAAGPLHVQPQTFKGPDGSWTGYSWREPHVERRFDKAQEEADRSAEEALPEALFLPVAQAHRLPRPLSPSGAGTIVDVDAEAPQTISPLFGAKSGNNFAAQLGRIVHRMLQSLPDFPVEEQESAARRYLDRAVPYWPGQQRQTCLDAILKLLRDPRLAPIFTAKGQAEVSIMGRLRLGTGDYAVSGRVDRLTVLEDRVVIVDYKTNRQPPQRLEDIPLAHKAQLAIYRELLKPLYPDKRIDCLLVYTESAILHDLSAETMSQALAAVERQHR